MFLHAGLGPISPKWLLPLLSVALSPNLWWSLWLTALLGPCLHGKPALSPPCWPCHHLPLLSRAGWQKALGIFPLGLPQTKKEGKCQRRRKIKARQDITILQHPWQWLRLPGKSPPLCVLQAAVRSFLPKWDQALHARGEEPCDFTHKKLVAPLGVGAKS